MGLSYANTLWLTIIFCWINCKTESSYFTLQQRGAIDCREFKASERLVETALSENPPEEIAEELKGLLIQINLRPYFQSKGINIDDEQINALIAQG